MFVSVTISYAATEFTVEYFSLGDKAVMITAIVLAVVAKDLVSRVIDLSKNGNMSFRIRGK